MTLDEYQKKAREFALYPPGLAYPVLGLVGEWTELRSDWDAKEAGDVLWYCANVAYEYGITLDRYITHFAGDPERAIGRIAERTKKVLRDKHGTPDNSDQEFITEQLGKIIRFLEGRFVLSVIMHNNIAKLTSRMARGVIQGSGDDR